MSESSEDEAAEVQGDGDDTNAIQQVVNMLGRRNSRKHVDSKLNDRFYNYIMGGGGGLILK